MRTSFVLNLRPFVAAVAALGLAACSHGTAKSPIRRVSPDGKTQAIATDGVGHVAYLFNALPSYGAMGELHVAGADGKDTKIADGMAVGGYLLSSDGKGLLFTQQNASGDDASLSWVDLANPAAPPKSILTGGLQTQPINEGSATPTFPVPLTSQGFLSPSGRFYVVGVLAPQVSGSPDMHVIDLDSGADVLVRDNGAFDYLELVLPNDVMVFQDAVGGNGGIAGGARRQTRLWVDLTSGTPTPTQIATRTGAYTPTGDNKTIVYQDADTRELYAWDAVARPAAGTKIASNALGFAVGTTGPVAYIGTDRSLHVVGLDGSALLDVDQASANADLFSPVVISDDGTDVYWFQAVDSQDGRGTLMHVAVSAGATPAKVADSAALLDVHPVDGGLVYLANVDGTGTMGDAFRSARDGSGATALGTGVPLGSLSVSKPAAGGSGGWLSAHLTATTENKNQKLVDAVRGLAGGLELTSASANSSIDPMVRIGQFALSDDLASLVYVGGSAFDAAFDNYVGGLEFVPTATPSMKPAMPLLAGVTEIGPVVKRSLFVNAPAAAKPGVYFVSF
jgi:hypothetical protein